MKEILFGVTGIGYGHTFRQLPLIEHFSQSCRVMIYGYRQSYEFFQNRFKNHPHVKVEPVAVPFYVGNHAGIDFAATATHPYNQNIDFLSINCQAFVATQHFIGQPDLVISDYEPVSAQYAYLYQSPFVTIDQQSKYLSGDFPSQIANFTYEDEVKRLHMFFPKADARLACSFFSFKTKPSAEKVLVYPPILKNSVVNLKRKPDPKSTPILLYISGAREFPQTLEEILSIIQYLPHIPFHIFVPKDTNLPQDTQPNISLYTHGDPRFDQLLEACHGIISTAGHSLLSEAMHLNIPVYAIPISPYEQHLNAHIISSNQFGISYPTLELAQLKLFIDQLPAFVANIKNDTLSIIEGKFCLA